MARVRAPRKAAADRSPEQRLIDAALELAAQQGWRRTGLAEIAAAAGLKLHEAYALHRSKASILRAFTRHIDAEVLAGADAAKTEGGTRERLFDTLMRRFDALKPHRQALRAILHDSVGDPAAIGGMIRLRRSMGWMLAAAGIATAGCRGRVMTHATLGLYLSVLRVFLGDDSADLGKTMAALDRGLQRAESICRFAGRFRGEERAAPAA
jgi:AcrR family transcriptional regulator